MAEPTQFHAAVPVLATKLRRPSTPMLLVARPRLLDQLAGYVDRRLILVSAPAGYGKTALISHWLAGSGRAYAWLSLDEQDNDAATFLLYLVSAIRCAYPDALAAVEQLLRGPMLLPPIRLADAVLQGLAALPGPLIVALDDYHVIKAPAVHELMARVVEHLPGDVQLVVITRADPPLPLDRLRGRVQLGETRAADLRFDAEEARLLLQRMLGPGVSHETVALLEDSTEGWAVGLQLAGLSMRGRSDTLGFALRIARHGHQSVTEYLLSEVLACLPQGQVDCLLQSSLFDRFCAPLIDAAQVDDGAKQSGDEFLRSVRRANLFVVSLDEAGNWFRYHHFFQFLLRTRLSHRYTNAEIQTMHDRAAAWFQAQGLVDEALTHFLKAGDPLAAASLVEAQVPPALDREEWRQIERWILLLPSDLVSARPRLLIAQAWLHFIRWQFGAIEARLDAAEGLIRQAPAAEQRMDGALQAEIDTLRAALALNTGNPELAVLSSEAAIAAQGARTGYTAGQAHFNFISGLQAAGQYERGVEFGHRQLDASGWQPHAMNLRLLLALVNIHHEMANLPPLVDLVPTFQKLARQSGAGLSVGWSQYAEGWVLYQRNELQAAEQAFCRFTEVAWGAHGRALVDGYTGQVLTALALGRPDEASEHIRGLNERLLERGMLALAPLAQSLEQRVALARGLPSALDWRPDPGLAVPTDIWEQPLLTHVRTLLAVGSPEALVAASGLLADSRTRALARNSNRKLIEIGALQARVLSAQGNETAALTALKEAVERAAPGGTLRLLADCGASLIPLLCKLLDAGLAPIYIQKLLAAFGDPAASSQQPATPSASASAELGTEQAVTAEMLTNREIDVLILLAERLSDKEIAERLVLSPVTVKKHSQRIYRKLNVQGRRSAVARARHLGLI